MKLIAHNHHKNHLTGSKTPITLQVVQPAVVPIGQNAPVRQLPSDVCLRACDIGGEISNSSPMPQKF